MNLLEETNAQLLASNKDLEQFAYTASHGLQEPINTISSFGDILESKVSIYYDPKANKIIGFMKNGSQRMKELINDILSYSGIGLHNKLEK